MQKQIKIQALDTLFFKDARPFDMGEDNWAQGMFPPPPSVLYGAIRAAYLNQMPEVKPDSEEDWTKEIKIRHIYYEFGGNAFFPLPNDLVEAKETKSKELIKKESLENAYTVIHNKLKKVGNFIQENHSSSSLLKDTALTYVPNYPEEVQSFSNGVIDEDALWSYLSAETFEFSNAKKLGSIIKQEPKTGIGRDNITHATSEGKLYRVGMQRLKNNKGQELSLVVHMEVPDALKDIEVKTLKFAENKIAEINDAENVDIEPKFSDVDTFFKIVLTTPTIFEQGWKPDEIKNAELIGAMVGKPVPIGGFDIKNKSPKPLIKAVPAGSVYYYRIKEGSKIDQVIKFIKQSKPYFNSDKFNEKDKEGFGIYQVGRLPIDNLLNDEPWK